MTTEEFSNEFDSLIRNYYLDSTFNKQESPISLEFDEYEKSVFLTKAQESIIIEFYNGKNTLDNSFEKTEEVRKYLSSLVKTQIITEVNNTAVGVSENSKFFTLPSDVWFITYESVIEQDTNKRCLVIPTTQDDYYRISNNPFKRAGNKRALRLDNNSLSEIITTYNVDRYLIRYLAKPDPIILTDLPNNLSINTLNIKTECKLNPVIHRLILERAVQLAISSKSIYAGK